MDKFCEGVCNGAGNTIGIVSVLFILYIPMYYYNKKEERKEKHRE